MLVEGDATPLGGRRSGVCNDLAMTLLRVPLPFLFPILASSHGLQLIR
jgi:hypothetical protein